ncbi:MAG: class I SAM-dependent methyltransferase [Candidatus Methylacidiphilaceae bacterium]
MDQRHEAVREEAGKLGPWWFEFRCGELVFGGNCPRDRRKTELLFEWAERLGIPLHEILELGSHEGSHTLQLAEPPFVKRVVGLEGRGDNFARANFVKRIFGCRKCEFHQTDLEVWQPAPGERYDAVFCAGLLYHLVRPWELIDKVASCQPRLLFLDTHYAPVETALAGRWAGQWMGEGSDPLSGLSPQAFWLSFKDLSLYLMEKGFLIRFVQDMEHHGNGPRVLMVAERSDAVGAAWSAVQQVGQPDNRKKRGVGELLRTLEKKIRERRKRIFGG